MSFIQAAIGDTRERQAVAEGEYDLRVLNFEEKLSKKGSPMLVAALAIEGEADAEVIREYFSLPTEDDSDDIRALKLRNLKRFLAKFNVPWEANGFSTDDVVGQTARCLLAVEADENDPDRTFNRLRLPKFRNDG